MTAPFIPTGRELDEGVTGPGLDKPPPRRPSLIRRLLGRPAKHTGKNLTDVELTLSDHVAAKPRGIRPREVPPEQAMAPEPAPAPIPAKPPAPAPPRQTSPRSPAPTKPEAPASPEAFLPGEAVTAAVVALARRPEASVSTIVKAYCAAEPRSPDGDLLTWWFTLETKTHDEPPASFLESASDDVWAVLLHLAEQRDSKPLSGYQVLLDTWDQFDQAERNLSRCARAFPTLEPLVRAVAAHDLHKAQAQINYQSAAWHENRDQISAAMSCLQACLSAGPRPPMARLPRARDGMSAISVAVLSTFCTPSSARPVCDQARETLTGADLVDAPPAVRKYVSRLTAGGAHHGTAR